MTKSSWIIVNLLQADPRPQLMHDVRPHVGPVVLSQFSQLILNLKNYLTSCKVNQLAVVK
jgi:hypothetical protein